jgi:hypothetical protein
MIFAASLLLYYDSNTVAGSRPAWPPMAVNAETLKKPGPVLHEGDRGTVAHLYVGKSSIF